MCVCVPFILFSIRQKHEKNSGIGTYIYVLRTSYGLCTPIILTSSFVSVYSKITFFFSSISLGVLFERPGSLIQLELMSISRATYYVYSSRYSPTLSLHSIDISTLFMAIEHELTGIPYFTCLLL